MKKVSVSFTPAAFHDAMENLAALLRGVVPGRYGKLSGRSLLNAARRTCTVAALEAEEEKLRVKEGRRRGEYRGLKSPDDIRFDACCAREYVRALEPFVAAQEAATKAGKPRRSSR